MKHRLINAVVLILFIFLLCGCTKNANGEKHVDTVSSATEKTNYDNSIETTEEKEQKQENPRITEKKLVVYFSATGTTKRLAEYAADILNCDIYEIQAENPYTKEDLAYYTNGRADKEQNDPSSRPAISGKVENMEQYDTIILGYPIWHGQAPRIISTFLESYDFSGKIILPFCTSHSSGIGNSTDSLHNLASDADWMEGKRFGADTTKENIYDWIAAYIK